MKDMTETFFCDTYAMIGIIYGHKNYSKYKNCAMVTLDYNLAELYYALLREHGKDYAEEHFWKFSNISTFLPQHIIPRAMSFKLKHKKQKLSYADCLGYAFALTNKIKFLTGDQKFEKLSNVEFAK